MLLSALTEARPFQTLRLFSRSCFHLVSYEAKTKPAEALTPRFVILEEVMARKFAIGLLAMVLALSALVVGCGNGIGTGVGGEGAGTGAGGNEQRLVGRWANLHGGSTVVFNSDGTTSGLPYLSLGGVGAISTAGLRHAPPTHWAAAGDMIILYNDGVRSSFYFRISSDGQTLIIGNMAFMRQ